MKANEIMVGDIFMVNKDVSFKKGTIVMVHGIDADRRFQELKGCATCVAIDDQDEMQGGVWLDYLDPIPLTPEILEKNGFKGYNGLYRLDITEGVFVNADFKSKEPFVSVHNTCYRATPICRYLHQLQQALRLCGIDKTIEL